jgi:hypothetical protein
MKVCMMKWHLYSSTQIGDNPLQLKFGHDASLQTLSPLHSPTSEHTCPVLEKKMMKYFDTIYTKRFKPANICHHRSLRDLASPCPCILGSTPEAFPRLLESSSLEV